MDPEWRLVQPREVNMKTKAIAALVLAVLPIVCVLAEADSACASQLDPKCFGACNKTYKGCIAGCSRDRTCINDCIHTFRECTSGCRK